MQAKNRYIVVGPPGCGKTHHISRMVENASHEKGIASIAVCSLTKAAAIEAAGRVDLPRNQVGTLHSFAYRALEHPTIAESKVKEFNKEHPRFAIKEQMLDRNPDYMSPEERFDNDWYAKVNLLRAQRNNKAIGADANRQAAYDAWCGWKQDNGYFDFTDLIEFAAQASPVMPGAPSLIFVDEHQDMSALEMDLLNKWSIGVNQIVTVGDPYQALYSWRGADSENFIPPGFDPRRIRVLSQSYRVPAAILSIAKDWLSHSPEFDAKHYHYSPTKEEGAVIKEPLVFPGRKNPNNTDLYCNVVESAEARKETMVLATCGYMLTALVEQLKDKGIPFHNPYRKTNGAWNPLTAGSARGRANARDKLEYYLRVDKTIHGSSARLWTEYELRCLLQAMMQKTRESKTPIFNDKDTRQNILDSKTAGDRLIDAETLKRLFTIDALRKVLTADLDFLTDALRKDPLRSIQYPLKVLTLRGYKALTETPKIIIGTIHSVKGGQCDAVFLCPDIPYPAWQQYTTLNQETLKALYRQFYVGMTRARSSLHLCRANTNMAARWAAPYLSITHAQRPHPRIDKTPPMLRSNPYYMGGSLFRHRG